MRSNRFDAVELTAGSQRFLVTVSRPSQSFAQAMIRFTSLRNRVLTYLNHPMERRDEILYQKLQNEPCFWRFISGFLLVTPCRLIEPQQPVWVGCPEPGCLGRFPIRGP